MSFQLALVTGATSGIGKEIAILLSKKSIPLILTGRDPKKLQELTESLHPVETLIADLSRAEDRAKIHQVIQQRTPDLIINNAGFGLYGNALEIPIDQQLEILEVNSKATVELTLLAAKALAQSKKRGVILNVSSIAGEYPSPGMSLYGASKAFLTHVSQSLDFEFKPLGIRVLVACPGMVDTQFSDRAAGKHVEAKGGPVITTENAALAIWKQIDQRKVKNIFDWRYRIIALITSHLIPKKFIAKMVWKRVMSRR